MFCTKCGMKLEENWTTCPYCGNNIAAEKEQIEMEASERENDMEQEEESLEDFGNYVELIKCLIQEHPVRSVLCVPFVIYTIYTLGSVPVYNIYYAPDAQKIFEGIKDLLFMGVDIFFGFSGLRIIYGTRNYAGIKERVMGKRQETVHTAEAIVMFVVCMIIKIIIQ